MVGSVMPKGMGYKGGHPPIKRKETATAGLFKPPGPKTGVSSVKEASKTKGSKNYK